MIDNATALARLQGYQALGRQMGLLPQSKPSPPAPSAPRSLASALYPNLPSSEKDHPNG
jgi:hypothetical protein